MLVFFSQNHTAVPFAIFIAFKGTMALIARQLHATQKFLLGLKKLPTFSEVRDKQLVQLKALVAKSEGLSTEKVADIISALDESLWEESSLLSLKQSLAEKIEDEEPKERRSMQDYTALPMYLDEHWWNVIEKTSSEVTILEQLTKHAGNLGLRCPTEQTMAMLCVLAGCLFRGAERSDQTKFEKLAIFKPKVKKWLQNLGRPSEYVTHLPLATAEFPEALLRAAYPAGFVAYFPSGVTVEGIMNLVKTYPLRKTNVAAQSSGSSVMSAETLPGGSGFHAMGQFLAGMLQGQASGAGPAQQAHQREKAAEDKALTCATGSVKPTTVLALTDGTIDQDGKESLQDLKTEAQEALSKRHSALEEPKPVSAQLNALRAGLYGEDDEGTDPDDSLKRPARARGRGRGRGRGRSTCGRGRGRAGRGRGRGSAQELAPSTDVLKRPDAAKERSQGVAKEAASKKRPAAETVSTGGLSKQERRKALLAKIPIALKKKFKDGCATCRYTPLCCPSCWSKRGYV